MKPVMILGASGMLGSTLMRTLPASLGCAVWGTVRGAVPAALQPHTSRLVTGVSAASPDSIRAALDHIQPSVLINCIGVIKQLDEGKQAIPCIQINALLPHTLHQLCQEREVRLVHISTDCVFSGNKGMYTELDIADPPDLYGQSKLLGEVSLPGAITLRTSIIGHEMGGRHLSLIDWFLAASGKVQGFQKAIYTGLPTAALSQVITRVIAQYPQLSGLFHVSSDPINKYDLLNIVRQVYGKTDVTIEADSQFAIDRSLDSSRFRQLVGWTPAAWPDLISTMHSDFLQCKQP